MSSSTKAPGKNTYHFDVSFDDHDPDKAAKILTTLEIQALKDDSFKIGYAQGEQDMQNSVATATKILLESINLNLEYLKEEKDSLIKILNEECAKLLYTTISIMAPTLTKQALVFEIEKHVFDAIERLGETAKLTLKVHPDMLEKITQAMDPKNNTLSKTLTIQPGTATSLGDYTLSWGTGSLTKNVTQIRASIKKCFETVIGTPSLDTIDTLIESDTPVSDAEKQDNKEETKNE